MDPYLLLQSTVEDEDEHALEGVKGGEEVGHDDGALVDVHKAESPGQAQQTQQGYCPDHPGPAEEGETLLMSLSHENITIIRHILC